MPRPKAIAFDLGKVLVDFDFSIAARGLAPHSAVDAMELQRLIDQSPLLHRLETGQLTVAEFVAEARRQTGFRGSHEMFCEIFADIFSPIEAMIGFYGRMKKLGFPTYIFSNSNDLAIGKVRADYPFFSEFDGYIISHQVGAMKPQARIYEALEALTGLRGAEILYLDDKPENTEAGAARGWQVVTHETPEKTIARVEALLND